MTNFEMVEILREKANVSYEEAKAALELTNWDLLEAMLLLEKEGKVSDGATATYSTRQEPEPAEEKTSKNHDFRNAVKWLLKKFRDLVRIGNSNHFVVTRRDKECISLPVTVVAILLICFFWAAAIALVVGLFCGLRYSFKGAELGRDSINGAMNKAAEAAENVKEEIRSSSQNAE